MYNMTMFPCLVSGLSLCKEKLQNLKNRYVFIRMWQRLFGINSYIRCVTSVMTSMSVQNFFSKLKEQVFVGALGTGKIWHPSPNTFLIAWTAVRSLLKLDVTFQQTYLDARWYHYTSKSHLTCICSEHCAAIRHVLERSHYFNIMLPPCVSWQYQALWNYNESLTCNIKPYCTIDHVVLSIRV